MRYGTPSIEDAMKSLRAAGVDDIIIFPLYPQYASSSTGTALELVYQLCATEWNRRPASRTFRPFYDHPAFIAAFAKNMAQSDRRNKA